MVVVGLSARKLGRIRPPERRRGRRRIAGDGERAVIRGDVECRSAPGAHWSASPQSRPTPRRASSAGRQSRDSRCRPSRVPRDQDAVLRDEERPGHRGGIDRMVQEQRDRRRRRHAAACRPLRDDLMGDWGRMPAAVVNVLVNGASAFPDRSVTLARRDDGNRRIRGGSDVDRKTIRLSRERVRLGAKPRRASEERHACWRSPCSG